MARKSRKSINRQPERVYQTAVYARLSNEDSRGESIENQIRFLEDYISRKTYLKHRKTYIDNGISGTVFDRPGLNALFADIETGNVDCIVVKDLSRLGRNYIETGNCLENIFPFPGVRFISVNDNYDSEFLTQNQALEMSVKSLVHDLYAKDISKKIAGVLDAKKKKGEFLGRYAPLGYKKSADSKVTLEVDHVTSFIIKEIFQLRLQGFGCNEIARRLNNQGIPTQSLLLFEKGITKEKPKKNTLWHASTVMSILKNPVYTGCLIERKYEKSALSGKKILISSEQRRIIPNTHSAIIDSATFEAVQKTFADPSLISKDDLNIKPTEFADNYLRGLVVCGNCGGLMVRSSGYFSKSQYKYVYRFYCPKKYEKTGICNSKSIPVQRLEEILRPVLNKYFNLYSDNPESTVSDMKENTTELRKTSQNTQRVNILRNNAYEKFKNRRLQVDEFINLMKKYEKQALLNKCRLSRLHRQKIDTFRNPSIEYEKVMKKLISRVVIYPEKIQIHFNFFDCVKG